MSSVMEILVILNITCNKTCEQILSRICLLPKNSGKIMSFNWSLGQLFFDSIFMSMEMFNTGVYYVTILESHYTICKDNKISGTWSGSINSFDNHNKLLIIHELLNFNVIALDLWLLYFNLYFHFYVQLGISMNL